MSTTGENQAKNTFHAFGAMRGRMEAKGIVTRQGHDLGHGGVAIEPGAEGIRHLIVYHGLLVVFLVALCVAAFNAGRAYQVQRLEQVGAGLGGPACGDAQAGAVPLGNTGTTTGEGAQ